MTPRISDLLSQIAEWLRMSPPLHSGYLDLPLAPFGYQLARVRHPGGTCVFVLLKDGEPIAHASGADDCEAIQILVKRC